MSDATLVLERRDAALIDLRRPSHCRKIAAEMQVKAEPTSTQSCARSRPFLSASGASFRLGERLVFEGLNWRFCRHQHWALVGGNGAGKSVLADALRGQIPLVRGELTYHFRPPPGLSAEEAIGHVSFDERKLELRGVAAQSRWNSFEEEESLRVADFLAYERVMEINPFEVLRHDGLARRRFEARRNLAVRRFRLEPFRDRTLLSLSNGETQRVQLARTLCRPLRLLILDEPFTGLDVARRAAIGELLDELMGGSVRLLLVTAREEELPRRITHVLRVEDCRVVAAGSRAEVLIGGFRTSGSSRGRQPRIPSARGGGGEQSLSGSAATRGAGFKTIPGSRVSGANSLGDELVRMERVTVRYGEALILDRVDWRVREGEHWALVGPNGSGKSTLLSLILGDNPQVYGNEVVVFGKRRGTGESVWEIKQQIGWVSPELQLHFDNGMTCFEAVASGCFDTVGLFERPSVRQRAAARAWLARFGLVEQGSLPLSSLSAGLRRMVLLARALVKRPRLLVLDEPCQDLDAAHREAFLGAVDELLAEGGVTVIYVTHRREEIPSAVRRVLRLERGKATQSRRR